MAAETKHIVDKWNKRANNSISDMAEIVHCKDCEYGEADYGWDGKIITPFQYHCEYEDTWNRPDHYCGYGKRKDNDNE